MNNNHKAFLCYMDWFLTPTMIARIVSAAESDVEFLNSRMHYVKDNVG